MTSLDEGCAQSNDRFPAKYDLKLTEAPSARDASLLLRQRAQTTRRNHQPRDRCQRDRQPDWHQVDLRMSRRICVPVPADDIVGQVDDPVLRDTAARIDERLAAEVALLGDIGHFDEQGDRSRP